MPETPGDSSNKPKKKKSTSKTQNKDNQIDQTTILSLNPKTLKSAKLLYEQKGDSTWVSSPIVSLSDTSTNTIDLEQDLLGLKDLVDKFSTDRHGKSPNILAYSLYL
jgi:hypothetical protein